MPPWFHSSQIYRWELCTGKELYCRTGYICPCFNFTYFAQLSTNRIEHKCKQYTHVIVLLSIMLLGKFKTGQNMPIIMTWSEMKSGQILCVLQYMYRKQLLWCFWGVHLICTKNRGSDWHYCVLSITCLINVSNTQL